MIPLVCPICSRESSPHAYVCSACNHSFVRVRSEPYATRIHKALAAFSVLQILFSTAALIYFDSLIYLDASARWAALLFHLMIDGGAWKYYHDRAALRAARFFQAASTDAGTHGWVAKDAVPLLFLAMSMLLTIGLVLRGPSL